MNKKINWSLYGAVLSVNLVSLITGAAYAWTSPVLPKLKDARNIDQNPFGRTITPFEESWVTSLLSVGASIGPFLSATVVDKIGRKKTLMALTVPMIISHLILAFTTNINVYFFSRLLLGLGIGCTFSVVPMYVGEIAEDANRGALGCVMSIMGTLGTLFCYTVGPFVSINLFCLLIVVPAIVFLIMCAIFVPESPYYLLMRGREEPAKLALKKVRRESAEKEFEEMKKNVEISNRIQINLTQLLKSKAIYKGLLIGSGLMFFQQCSGITVIVSYMQSIFEDSGSSIPSDVSVIIIGTIQLCINFLTSQLVDRLGRRFLLLLSLLGMFLSHIFLGIYFYLKTNHFDEAISYLSWLPVCSLIFYIIMFTAGIGPVTWAMVGELFPTHLRSYASTFVCFICLFLAFVLTLTFPNLISVIGLAWAFWIFAGFCIGGIVFVWKVVPETKGKSLHDIQIALEHGSKL